MANKKIKSPIRAMAEADVRTTEELSKNKKKQHKVLDTVGYVAGSVAFFAAACAIIPSILSNVSGALYKSSLKKANHDDDDWGPLIERKEQPGDSEQPAQIELQEEEGVDGD